MRGRVEREDDLGAGCKPFKDLSAESRAGVVECNEDLARCSSSTSQRLQLQLNPFPPPTPLKMSQQPVIVMSESSFIPLTRALTFR